jgi:disulfide bond formation protein DsbB
VTSKSFNYLFLGWVVSVIATLGSLFFSEVIGYAPCSLCWYQRIFMYPLVLVLAKGLFPLDQKVYGFSLPLALVGWVFALYHNLLHWNIIPENAAPCRQGVACSTVYIDWLGFVTIPLLSLVAFSMVIILLFLFNRNFTRENSNV